MLMHNMDFISANTTTDNHLALVTDTYKITDNRTQHFYERRLRRFI